MRLAKCESQIGMPEKKAIRFCDSQPDSQRCVRVRSLRGRCLRVCKNKLAISEFATRKLRLANCGSQNGVATDATRKRVPSLFASRKWAFCIPFPILHCRKLRIGPFASRKRLLHLALSLLSFNWYLEYTNTNA
ncbi:hypothetical protein NDU88_010049 [Pleurodeles waltl]|uniref:Uncharacterized protein n=1 Tax=Pleurodeles waltl TaxID=8319 RepID=A0AAV7QT97_PLEWA|nr:hypothetical protein NDU88_010049 [Pleurodeles waltl]